MQRYVEKVAYTAIFTALALILSYVESVIPLSLILPIPGFKPGFANLAVAAAFFIVGPIPAIAVSFIRILVNALLFGSVTSFMFSLSGGISAYITLVLYSLVLKKILGTIGLSVISAAMHNIGQCICAAIFFGYGVIIFYLPVLLIISLFTGTMTGVLLYFVLTRVPVIYEYGRTEGKKGV